MLTSQIFLVSFVFFSAMTTGDRYNCGRGCSGWGCFEPGCKAVSTLPIYRGQLVSQSPLYAQVVDRNTAQGVDSICFSVIGITPNCSTTFEFRVTVYSDASYAIAVNIGADIPGCPGSFKTVGFDSITNGCTDSVVTTYAYSEPCPGAFGIYRCSDYGGRSTTQFALSSEPVLSDSCKRRFLEDTNRQGLDTSSLVSLPNKLPKKCVTWFNGAPCLNANSVPPNSRIVLPYMTSAYYRNL